MKEMAAQDEFSVIFKVFLSSLQIGAWKLAHVLKNVLFAYLNAICGIRSLDETRCLNQSETVKVARAVKQKYEKFGAPPPAPFALFHQK